MRLQSKHSALVYSMWAKDRGSLHNQIPFLKTFYKSARHMVGLLHFMSTHLTGMLRSRNNSRTNEPTLLLPSANGCFLIWPLFQLSKDKLLRIRRMPMVHNRHAQAIPGPWFHLLLHRAEWLYDEAEVYLQWMDSSSILPFSRNHYYIFPETYLQHPQPPGLSGR